jgi:hypothetical protein
VPVPRTIVILAALGFLLFCPTSASAQAWALPEGVGSVSIAYHHVYVKDHFFSSGDRHDVGHIRTHVMTADIEYGITDRVSLKGTLPFVSAKYVGSFPHRHIANEPPADFEQLDGHGYHSGLQDLRVEARYGAVEFPVALAPFVALSVPLQNYEVFAHSAIGLHMTELQVGTYAGGLIGPLSIHGRVTFGFYERVSGIRRNRSTFDTEFGFSPGRRLRLFAFQTSQISHGGVEIPFGDPTTALEEWWPHHDQVNRANFMNLGGGASIGLSDSVSMQASILASVAGRNTHAARYGVTLATTWAFGTPRTHHPSPRQPQ